MFRYHQAVAMTRFYKRPILLIEFDPNKSFSLQVSVPSGDVTLGNVSHSPLYSAISRNGFYFVLSLLEQNVAIFSIADVAVQRPLHLLC